MFHWMEGTQTHLRQGRDVIQSHGQERIPAGRQVVGSKSDLWYVGLQVLHHHKEKAMGHLPQGERDKLVGYIIIN